MRRTAFATAMILVISGMAQSARPGFTPIAEGVEVHTTYNTYKGSLVPSNGLIVLTKDSVVLIDTGWGIQATKAVLRHVERRWDRPVAACFSTHFHDDRTAGIPVLRRQGVRCMGTQATHDLALKEGNPAPDVIIPEDTLMVIDGMEFHFFHPGAGHTRDNMVVWLPARRILHGGCLVKSMEATDMGYIGDADLETWPDAVRSVQHRFREAVIIVPGHGAWGRRELLEHTLGLLKEHGVPARP
jgi:metallo-beta-lactamase class B